MSASIFYRASRALKRAWTSHSEYLRYVDNIYFAPPGGGGYSDLVPTGGAAEAAKPVPIFKGHFGGKGYPLLVGFYSTK